MTGVGWGRAVGMAALILMGVNGCGSGRYTFSPPEGSYESLIVLIESTDGSADPILAAAGLLRQPDAGAAAP